VAMGTPHFVIRIETETQRVVIGPPEALDRSGLTAVDTNWLVDPKTIPMKVGIQIRYNGSPLSGRVILDHDDLSRFEAEFDSPQRAVAPGQAAVLYDGDRVLGGGWIE